MFEDQINRLDIPNKLFDDVAELEAQLTGIVYLTR
jgi:hypothetical protein